MLFILLIIKDIKIPLQYFPKIIKSIINELLYYYKRILDNLLMKNLQKSLSVALMWLPAIMAGSVVPVSNSDLCNVSTRCNHFLTKEDNKGSNKSQIKNVLTSKSTPKSKWLARTQTVYRWYDEWSQGEVLFFVYNNAGQKIQEVEDGEWYRICRQYTWNQDNQLASSIESVAYEPEFEYEPRYSLFREYDTQVPSFITLNEEQNWDDESWTPSYDSYRQTVKRDDAGNVTLVERSRFMNGDYCPEYRLRIEYGNDGIASRIEDAYFDYLESRWEEESLFEDIEWENTDGQIVSMEDWSDYLTGANRIRSARVILGRDDIFNGNPFYLTVEYNGDEFTADINGYEANNGLETEVSLEYVRLDAVADPDSYHYVTGWNLTLSEVKRDEAGNTVEEFALRKRQMCDENDLLLLDVIEIGANGEWLVFDKKVEGEVVYDEEDGYPLSWTVSEYRDNWFDEDDEEGLTLATRYRIDYSDYYYNDVTGGVSVGSPSDGPIRYYNMQGQPVSNPSDGLFIRVNGSKIDKVIVN